MTNGDVGEKRCDCRIEMRRQSIRQIGMNAFDALFAQMLTSQSAVRTIEVCRYNCVRSSSRFASIDHIAIYRCLLNELDYRIQLMFLGHLWNPKIKQITNVKLL